MSSTAIVIAIIGGLILAFILWKWLKPYIIKYDTTILITGGLGSGKSLTSVKKAVVLLRKNRFFKWKLYNLFSVKIGNKIRQLSNKRRTKKGKTLKVLKEPRKKPRLYSNIPIHFKTATLGRKREWSEILSEQHLLLTKAMEEYSVILIDEFPQFVNQFMWKEEIVQDNLNEFITFFRHYIGGYLIINAQSQDEIECHFRRKLNQAIWCFNFKKHLFGLFYTIEMADIMLSDSVQTMSTTYIEDNTKKNWGLFPPRGTYDTRCYSERYKNILDNEKPHKKFNKIKTNKILRMKYYVSPLDDETSKEEKLKVKRKAEKLGRKPENENA